jgi:hypothetical protein
VEAPVVGELGEKFAKLEFQYKTVIDLGKFMYDAYLKVATMTFTMNGLLITAVSFLLPHAGAAPDDLYRLGIRTAGFIGVVYNCGAFFTFLAISFQLRNLFKMFAHLDGRLELSVNAARTRVSDFLGSAASILTMLFFCVWLAAWAYICFYVPGVGTILSAD